MAIRRPTQRSVSQRAARARIEFVWTWSLAVYSVVASAYLSVMVYVKIVSKPEWNEIDTLAELSEVALTIYIPDILEDTGNWMECLR